MIRARLTTLYATTNYEKIQLLKRKADSTTFPHEREAALRLIKQLQDKIPPGYTRQKSDAHYPHTKTAEHHEHYDSSEPKENHGVHEFVHSNGSKAMAYVDKHGTITQHMTKESDKHVNLSHPSLEAAKHAMAERGFKYHRKVE